MAIRKAAQYQNRVRRVRVDFQKCFSVTSCMRGHRALLSGGSLAMTIRIPYLNPIARCRPFGEDQRRNLSR